MLIAVVAAAAMTALSAAGPAAGLAAALALLLLFHRVTKTGDRRRGSGARVISSAALPGGARVHEISWRGKVYLAGDAGGELRVLDTREDTEGEGERDADRM